MMEVAGFVVGSAPLLLQATQDFRQHFLLVKQVGPAAALRILLLRSRSGTSSPRSSFRDLRRVHGGLTAGVLVVFFQEAVDHMDQVERQILRAQAARVSAFMQSVASGCHLIGVTVGI
jgi:hypothetical protein